MEEKQKKIGICITIPKTIKWEDYQKELDAVADYSQVMNFKVANLPKKLEVGSRVYLCYNGNIIGWQTFVGFYNGEFTCSTTGKDWKGGFIQRSGPFHYLKTPIPCKGFRGFKYINYNINESITAKKLIQESRSINDKVQSETKKLIDTIENKLDGNKTQKITFKQIIFDIEFDVTCSIYNRSNINDCFSISNNIKKENYTIFNQKTIFLTLFFVNGKSINENYDTIAHEVSHIFQTFLSYRNMTDVNQLLHSFLNSKNIFEKKLAYLLYLSDSNEQDSIIQGLEASLNQTTFLDDNQIYEVSYANEALIYFEKLIKQLIKYKEKFTEALIPYKQYNLDYNRVLKRAKNSFKRFKLKIGHILSTHENIQKGRPDIKKIKEITKDI